MTTTTAPKVRYTVPASAWSIDDLIRMVETTGQTMEQIVDMLKTPVAEDVVKLKLRMEFQSNGYVMKVTSRTGLLDFDEKNMTDNGCAEIIATSDGRNYISKWHEGPRTPHTAAVFVERWTKDGRTFHGYIDATSRKIVQTG
jgi:hypothetical protein